MGLRRDAEKGRPGRMRSRTSTIGRISIVVCQNVLLWMSLYVAASTAHILILGIVNANYIPSVALYLLASTLSLSYLILQNTTTHLRKQARNIAQSDRVDTFQALATHTLRILVTIWMVACGLTITFTAARRPLCASPKSGSKTLPLDKGNTCIINRMTILTGLIALVTSGILFILLHKVNEPYRCHLMGIVKEHKLTTFQLPYKQNTHRAMFSEMSFKCHSSTSLSSRTTKRPLDGSATHSIASAPAQPYGLGIYTFRPSAPPSLLQPRPSLTSIRSHTSLYLPHPPASPLPPLPAYIPTNRNHIPNLVHRAMHPPRRPYRSDDSVRMVPQSPAPNPRNLAVLNRSRESISSIYSRSTSGESRRSPAPVVVISPGPHMRSRTTSSSSSTTSTPKRSPFGLVSVAKTSDQSEAVVSLRKTALVIAKPRSLRSFSSSDSSARSKSTFRTRTLSASESSIESLRPLDLKKCRSMKTQHQQIDQRLKGYVESQNRIREQSMKVSADEPVTPASAVLHERKNSGPGRVMF